MYAKLINNLEALKMEKTVTYIKDYLDVVAKKEIGLMEALIQLTDIEIEHRTAIASKTQMQLMYFISCYDLIQNLKKAYDENRLEARLKHYNKYRVLIIDEIGYLPVDKLGANLFFQLITKRYDHTSTIFTINQPFSKWVEVFSDITLVNAILDRLLHHSHVIKIIGPSYRTKNVRDLISEDKN